MTTIRQATAADMPTILDLGARFHAYSGDPIPFCRVSAAATAQGLLQMGFVLLAERDGQPVGMIGVAVVPMFFNAAHLMAQELMWWVDETGRAGGVALALLREAEAAAKQRGAKRMQMIALANSPPHVATLYGRLGYQHRETAFSKEL